MCTVFSAGHFAANEQKRAHVFPNVGLVRCLPSLTNLEGFSDS